MKRTRHGLKACGFLLATVLGLSLSVFAGKDGKVEFAAKELRTFAGDRASDFTPVTLAEGRAILPRRVVETLDAAKSKDAFVLAAAARPDGKTRVFIAGKTGRAVVYGAYALLEDYLGFRFFHAGNGGTVVPARLDARIPGDLFDFREPRVRSRRISHWYGSVQPSARIEDYDAWLVRRTYQTEREEHGLQLMVRGVPLSLFAAHPEYFPLIGGARSEDVAKKHERRCCSNPEVQRLTAAAAIEAANTGKSVFLDVRNETGFWCECPACRKMGQGTNGVFSVTDYVHRFHAAVSRLVLEQVPDAEITAHAYRDFRFPPQQADLAYDPRVRVLYTPIPRCYAHPITAPCNGRFRREFEDWHRHAVRLGIFGWSSSSRQRYTPLAPTFAQEIRWLVDHGFDGWRDNNTAGGDKLSLAVGDWRLFYLASKMFWNPDLDAAAELADADRRYYGVACGPMGQYWALLQKRWAEAPGHAAAGAYARHLDALKPGDADRLQDWLAEAEKLAAGDDDLLARIGFDRIGLENYWVKDGARHAAEQAAQPGMATARAREIVNGFPSDADWRAAPYVDFAADGKPPAEATRVALLHDEANWYVRFDQEFAGEPVTPIGTHDGDVWTQDAVEVFVSAPGEGWRQVIVSPNGAIYDADGPCDVDWSFGGEVRNVRTPGRLLTDIRLPVARLRSGGRGLDGEWRFRFTRDNARKGPGGEVKWSRVKPSPARTHELVERRIAACKAVGGRYVSLEAGEWRFGRPVRLTSGFSIRLERGARLVLEKGADCAFFVFDGVTNGEILGMDSRDMPVMVGSGRTPCVVFRDAVGTHCGARLDNIRFENGTAPAVSLVRSRGWFLMHLRNAVVDVGEECADITIDYPHGIYEEEKLLRKAPDAKNVRVCHLQGVRWRESCPARHRPLIPQPKKYVPKRGRCLMPGPRVEPWMLRRETNATLKSGAYRISVTSDRALVTASDEDGFFNAFQTLRQISEERPLCRTRDPYCGGETASDLMLPCCEVEDEPAFRWRGVHIDECRHFFGKAAILDALEQMAAYKLNVLHWHLTEDQGWRLAIDAFPKLTERGAIRRATQTRVKNGFCDLDGCTYGPFFYTKEDVREIVAFAAARRITIVPEIELPGHCRAALAAYPEFACFPEAFPHEPSCVWGVEDDVLCVGNPDAIRFFERVLDEVLELFPGTYVHIGGDECPTVRWKRCPKCRAKAASLGLKPEKLQGWVTAHFAKYLADRGRRAIGWDEILECDIPADTPVMSWRAESCAPSSGHPVVQCNARYNYYSCAPQTRGSGLSRVPDAKRVLDMPAVYEFDPFAGVPEKDRKNVIGAQACFWSEPLADATTLEMNMWPRLLALAEITWANPKKDYPEFLGRVRQHIDRLADQGVRLGPADLELGSERSEQK